VLEVTGGAPEQDGLHRVLQQCLDLRLGLLRRLGDQARDAVVTETCDRPEDLLDELFGGPVHSSSSDTRAGPGAMRSYD
jgi:hypothetical protein